MPAAPTLPLVSVEEYLRTHYEPHCEYLDGVLAPKAFPDYIHSTFQMLLMPHHADTVSHSGHCRYHTDSR
jgi:hypothetical protein